jgi:hypothetical protein
MVRNAFATSRMTAVWRRSAAPGATDPGVGPGGPVAHADSLKEAEKVPEARVRKLLREGYDVEIA